MNTRSKNYIDAGVDIVHFDAQGDFPAEPDPDFDAAYGRPDIEGIFEAYSGPNPSNGVAWTNFSHYKRAMGAIGNSVYELPYVTAWPNTGNRYWSGRFPTYFGWAQHSGLGHVMPTRAMYESGSEWGVISPPNLATLQQRAVNSIMPGIKAQLSLINSVYELKDFKSYTKVIRRRWTRFRELTAHLPKRFWARETLQDLYRGWRAYLSSFGKLTPGSQTYLAAKQASGYFLEWKFNLSSVIRDVLSANKGLASFEKDLNRFITNVGRVQVGHWSSGFEAYPSSSRNSSYSLLSPVYPPLSVTSEIQSSSTSMDALFHAEVRYNYNMTNYEREHARALAYLDAFGVNLNPAIIWNAMKFTFLIDWIVGVSQYLDQFKVRNLEPRINILGGLWSVRYLRTTTWTKVHLAGYEGTNWTQALSMPSINETGYLRRTWMPGISSLTVSGLNVSEFTLGAALVIAVSRRKARKRKV
jgi:hypothetical protein